MAWGKYGRKGTTAQLLTWVHPRFSVYAGPAVNAAETTSIEAQARYITRPVFAMDAFANHDDVRLVIETPPDPKTSATSIDLDPAAFFTLPLAHQDRNAY